MAASPPIYRLHCTAAQHYHCYYWLPSLLHAHVVASQTPPASEASFCHLLLTL